MSPSSSRISGRLALFACLASALPAMAACDNSLAGDPPAVVVPNALGSGSRISAVSNPDAGTASGATVYITGASLLTIDTYDETMNGKSKGTVYLQDFGSQAPYAGTSLYSPTYEPPDLTPAPGDVLDLTGTYTVNTTLGTAMFPPGTGLIQIDKPVVVPRFDYSLPAPVVIQAGDLDAWATGLRWTSMLVTVQNVTLAGTLAGDGSGRYTVPITSDTSSNGPTLSNELFDVQDWNNAQATPPLTKGTKLNITGIVTWFYNFHVAPRSPADIVVVQ